MGSIAHEWWALYRQAIISWRGVLQLAAAYVLAWAVWWWLGDAETAWGQAVENLIPAIAGAFVVAIGVALTKLGEARANVRHEKNEARRQASFSETEIGAIRFWLSSHLADETLGIACACLFGSVTHNSYPTSDVDVVLLYRPMSNEEYKRKVPLLRDIANKFYLTFGKPLHFQRYLDSESQRYQWFVGQQSEPISVIR